MHTNRILYYVTNSYKLGVCTEPILAHSYLAFTSPLLNSQRTAADRLRRHGDECT